MRKLEKTAQGYFDKGLAESTKKSYSSARNRYLAFCTESALDPFPVNEHKLSLFVSYAAQSGLKYQTIKYYLSGLRYTQISLNMGDPFAGNIMPRLEYITKGIKRAESENPARKTLVRMPITPTILQRLKQEWEKSALTNDTVMIWAACTLAFFGFLRIGEMTIANNSAYDPSIHLSISDVTFDHASSPSAMFITIKASKTDPFRKGITLALGRTYRPLCPVAAMAAYLQRRGTGSGPLFRFMDWGPLTRKKFVDQVKKGLTAAGVDQKKYNGHSFRIGAATTAAMKGMEDSLIKTLGRWESAAYLRYVKIPREQLLSYTRAMEA